MKARYVWCLFWVIAMAGCGGGGGGGGGSSPSNLGPGGGAENPTPEIKVGTFSDSPVSGLKYRQGDQEGFTDTEGRFRYDSNSDVPLEFLVGHISLGYANGAELITPFDLNASMASTNRGLNVARLLITLDIDRNPDNGIELPESTQLLAAELPFDLSPNAFEDDQVVRVLVERAGGDTLANLDEVHQHISRNSRIQDQISENSQFTDQTNRIEIGFDANLASVGLLARVAADNGEQLYLFSNPQAGWHLSSALYVNRQNNYFLINFDSFGFIRYVNSDGSGSKVLTSTAENTLSKIVHAFDFGNYRGSADNVLVDASGSGNISSAFDWDYSAIASINSAMSGFSEGQLSAAHIVRVAATIMGAIHQIRCDPVASCHNQALLRMSLDRWLVDSTFADRVTSVQQRSFNLADICLSFSSLDDGEVCGSQTSLATVISFLDGRLATDLFLWESRTIKFLPRSSDYDRGAFVRVYISSREDVSHRPAYEWNTSKGPVPEPWIEAEADIGMQVSVTRLSDDKLYFELQATGDFIRPLRVISCRYDFNRVSLSSDIYRTSCHEMAEGEPDVQAAFDLMDDLYSIAFRRSGILYKYVDSVSTRYVSVETAEFFDWYTKIGGQPGLFNILDSYMPTLSSGRHYSSPKGLAIPQEEVLQNPDLTLKFSSIVLGNITDRRFYSEKMYFDIYAWAPDFSL